MTVTINGTSGVTYPAGGTDNVAGSGVGTTDTQTLSNKSITAANSNTVEATSGPTSSQLSGNRNKIINGAMQVWQRGTTFTASGYGPDRWLLQVAGTTTFTQESSDVPAGAQYAVKWTTGAASSYGQIRQFLEQLNVIPLRGLAVTASAMVKLSSGFSGTLTFEIYYNATSDSASAGGWTACSYSVVGTPTSSAYTKITATFTVPSNAVGLYIGVVPTAAQPSGQYALQSLIQLEPGATATPFENRLYGTELALCQRYFESSWNIGTVPGSTSSNCYYAVFGGGGGTATTSFIGQAQAYFKVPKRTAPTITTYDAAATPNSGRCLRYTLGVISSNNETVTIEIYPHSGFSAYSGNGASAMGIVVGWKAEAEL